MSALSDERKKCLKDIGFERFIAFPITELPSSLAYHVIDKLHRASMENLIITENLIQKRSRLALICTRVWTIFEKFRIIHEARRELVETLKEGTKKFKGDETMKDFCNEYRKMFKRTKDNDLDESFMDWDDKSNSDDNDSDDNNNEDGTPMTDDNPGAKEQNENQSEKKDGDDRQTE
nr:hypothetical protein [Tanacetum cinerariifolium]